MTSHITLRPPEYLVLTKLKGLAKLKGYMPDLPGPDPLFSLDIGLCSSLPVSPSSCRPPPPPRTLPSCGVWMTPPRLLSSVWLPIACSCYSLSKRSDKGLAAKKGGIGGGPKVNWLVSSRSDSRTFMCRWKTPFSHSMPLGLSKWMPSEDALSGRECSIMLATSSSLTGSTLLGCICLLISLRLRTRSFISLAF